MIPINNVIPEKIINALGWVIIHSIWQGLLVAGLVALLWFVYRRHVSRVRYWIGVGALALMIVLSIVTFLNMYHNSPQNKMQLHSVYSNFSSPVTFRSAAVSEGKARLSLGGFWESVSSFLMDKVHQHLPLVVFIWFMGVMFLMIKSTAGIILNQKLKLLKSQKLSTFWQDKLKILCEKIRVRRPVVLAESSRIKGPITIGFLKPIILLPLGLVMSMPRDEVEAVLAHELAHIARKDYLVNMLQYFVDILFFYHPALRWVSKVIRAERENCCDDIAVTVAGNSVNVAKAITKIAETEQGNLVFVQTASGSRWSLLKRIKRLLNPPEKDYRLNGSVMGVFFLGFALITVVLGANVTRNFSMEMKKSVSPVETKKNPLTGDVSREDKGVKKSTSRKIKSRKFVVKNDIYVKIGGKVKINKGVLIHFRLVDVKSKKRIWKYTVDKKSGGIHTFTEKLFLKKGTYELESSQNCLDLFVEDLKSKSKNIIFSPSSNDYKEGDEWFIDKNEGELSRRERELDRREKEIKKREEALNRLEKRRYGDERKILEKEVAERARLEKEMSNREKFLEKQELENNRMEGELNRVRDEIKELQEREEKLSRKKLAELDKEEDQIRDEVEQIGDELEEIDRELEREEEKLKGEEEFLRRIIGELLKDKLIDDEDDFEFKLIASGLFINGKKHSKKNFIKYKKYYEQHRGIKLEKGKKFHIINKK